MPGLYGNTSTTYTVTASNVITLYQTSSATNVITATTYSTNLGGLYGGYYSPLPTSAQQLINLFDNTGNVNFYLNSATNSSTIFANFIGTVSGGVSSLTAGPGISVSTSSGAVVISNTGVLALTGTSAIGVSSNTGSITLTNLGVTSLTAGTNTNISASTGSITIWSAASTPFDISTVTNQALFTTSSVEFAQLEVTGSNIPSTQSSVLINASGSTVYQDPHASGYLLWGINKSTSTSARIVTDAYGGNNTASSVWTGRKSRGTVAAPTALQTGDLILRVAGSGFGTTQFPTGSDGYLDVLAAENFTDTAHGTRITLNTTNTGTNTINRTLSVASSGTVLTAPQVSAVGSAFIINQSGTANFEPAAANAGYALQVISKPTIGSSIAIDTYGDSDAAFQYSRFTGRRARGTAASPTAVQTNDSLARFQSNGYGTTKFFNTATGRLEFSATENFTDTAAGTKLQIWANRDGETTPRLLTTFRESGIFVYTTGTSATDSMLTVLGSGVDSTYKPPQNGTGILIVNKPGLPARFLVDTYKNDEPDSTDRSFITGRRARGTSDAPTAVQSGDALVRFNGYGYATTKFLGTSSAGINFIAAENFTDTAVGGKIGFDVMELGGWEQSSQTVVAYMDQYGIEIQNAKNLRFENLGQIGNDSGEFAFVSTVTDVMVKAQNGAVNATLNLLRTGSANIVVSGATLDIGTVPGQLSWNGTNSFSLTGGADILLGAGSNITFPDSTVQTTAWTGSISTTSNLVVNSLLTQDVVSSGGYPLDVNGLALITQASTQSVAMVVSNYTANLRPELRVRGYGQNLPGGTATTVPNTALVLESSRGTQSAPTALASGDVVGAVSFTGYDGANFLGNSATGGPLGFSPFQLVALTTENWANNGSTTTNAGIRMFMRAQPQGAQVNATSRQAFYATSWTAGSTLTNTPPTINVFQGSGIDGTAPLLTPSSSVGSFGTGYGAATMQTINGKTAIYGVPAQDTAPDNASLTASNFISFVGNRRSGVSGRRNVLAAGDAVGGLSFFAQSASNATGIGSQVGTIAMYMLEASGVSARGTKMQVYTVNSGTTTQTLRLDLDNLSNDHYSDTHTFNNAAGTTSIVSMSVASGVALKGYTETRVAAGYTASFAPDVSTATIWAMTLTGNITFSGFTNPVAGQSASVFLTQDATGSRLLTSTMKFASGSKTLSTAGGSIDMITVFYDGTNYFASLSKGYA